jgi:hypothetical protein
MCGSWVNRPRGAAHHLLDHAIAYGGRFQIDQVVRREIEGLPLAPDLRQDNLFADPGFGQTHDVFDRHAGRNTGAGLSENPAAHRNKSGKSQHAPD